MNVFRPNDYEAHLPEQNRHRFTVTVKARNTIATRSPCLKSYPIRRSKEASYARLNFTPSVQQLWRTSDTSSLKPSCLPTPGSQASTRSLFCDQILPQTQSLMQNVLPRQQQ